MLQTKPTLEEAKRFAAQGYRTMPVCCEVLSDICTPIEALRILKNVSDHCYILESVTETDRWGRYTFLGYDPELGISCTDGVMTVGDETLETDDPGGHRVRHIHPGAGQEDGRILRRCHRRVRHRQTGGAIRKGLSEACGRVRP